MPELTDLSTITHAFVMNPAHRAQLEHTRIPQHLWPALAYKISHDLFDAGNKFQMCHNDEEGSWKIRVMDEDGLDPEEENNIWLVDHAWTFEPQYAREQLKQMPQLLARMLALMDLILDLEMEDYETEEAFHNRKIEAVLQNMWKFANHYEVHTMSKSHHDDEYQFEDEMPDDKKQMWYIMDEFGSRFGHSFAPNMNFVIFNYQPTQVTYTVVYPKEDIPYLYEATRNYIASPNCQEARLHPWFPELLDLSKLEDNWVEKVMERSVSTEHKDGSTEEETPTEIVIKRKFKVLSTCPTVREYVTLEEFEQVKDQEEADILWLQHVRTTKQLFKEVNANPHMRINQFENEKVITVKDLFAQTAMRSVPLLYYLNNVAIPNHVLKHRGPDWLMTTFDTLTELPQFIKCFKEREANKQENTWIVKPWNMARAIGITITGNLNRIIKLADSAPPKIVCKYIDDPVCFHRPGIGWVKQELRFQVFLKSVDPLQVYVHDIFYTRFANHAFKLDDFDDYQKHFCVMAYKGFDLLAIPDKEWIPMFEQQNTQIKWEDVLRDTHRAIKDMMRNATLEGPPRGLRHSPHCVAAYGVDLIYRWADPEHTRIQPVILECNKGPQTSRGSKMYPPYWNEVFQTLFLDRPHPNMVLI